MAEKKEPQQKKIVVIDDEPEVCDLLKDFLELNGYQASVANRAADGLKIIEKESPDLVLLDIVMPQIDGLECLARIKKIKPDVIVVIISGLQDEKIAKEAIRRGAYDYIAKPFDFTYLRNNVLSRIFAY